MTSLIFSPQVLKPETVEKIRHEGLRAQAVAERWASGWPKETKAMEAAGTLMERLKE